MSNIEYNGIHFTRDENTGYYLSSKKIGGFRKRLHVYVYETEAGPVPKGYEVHHIDFDKDNNSIGNLVAITIEEHRHIHMTERHKDEEYKKKFNERHGDMVEKSKEWHSSEEGKAWHKRHYESMKDRLHREYSCVCIYCGVEYTSGKSGSMFCGRLCRSRYRKANGLDDEERICSVCGEPFMTNKYRNVKTCSPQCGTIQGHRSRKK